MSLGKVAQGFYVFSVQRTDNQVASGSLRVVQHLTDIAVLRHVPGTDICRDAIGPQTVAGHQHATIVLYHALAVAIDGVKGKYHTHAYLALTQIRGTALACGRRRHGGGVVLINLGNGLTLRERYLDDVALLQFVAGLVHLGIGIY